MPAVSVGHFDTSELSWVNYVRRKLPIARKSALVFLGIAGLWIKARVGLLVGQLTRWRGSSFIVQNGPRRDLRAMVQQHPARVERRLSAILAADVAGYSRLMGLDEVGTARILREHRAVSDALVAKHGGRIVKTTGDGC